ncbi:class I SAM-dependent methyltransferase [Alphaproteobacteria bacterium]|nr:class I SAM-dependent methyltransferase [Alphaproteobacteria bacterium]
MLDKRYKFKSTKNFVPMSEERKEARDSFLQKYKDTLILEKQNCYICGSRNFKKISEIDKFGFYYPTVLCKDCGNVQQEKYYSEKVLNDFYQNYYRKIYDTYAPEELFLSQKLGSSTPMGGDGESIYRFVKSFCTPKNVLEIGCGAGGILSVFKDKGCDVLGLDFDKNLLDVAKNNGIETLSGSIENIPPSRKFDLIILSHVLEHIVDPFSFLERVKFLLKVNAFIYIEVPSLNYVADGDCQYDLLRYWQNAHTIHFTEDTLTMLCKKVGLQNVKKTKFIHSLWQQTVVNQEISEKEKKSNYKKTIKLIHKIERKRKQRGFFVYFRKKIAFLLDKIGLKKHLKSIFFE